MNRNLRFIFWRSVFLVFREVTTRHSPPQLRVWYRYVSSLHFFNFFIQRTQGTKHFSFCHTNVYRSTSTNRYSHIDGCLLSCYSSLPKSRAETGLGCGVWRRRRGNKNEYRTLGKMKQGGASRATESAADIGGDGVCHTYSTVGAKWKTKNVCLNTALGLFDTSKYVNYNRDTSLNLTLLHNYKWRQTPSSSWTKFRNYPCVSRKNSYGTVFYSQNKLNICLTLYEVHIKHWYWLHINIPPRKKRTTTSAISPVCFWDVDYGRRRTASRSDTPPHHSARFKRFLWSSMAFRGDHVRVFFCTYHRQSTMCACSSLPRRYRTSRTATLAREP